MRNVADTPFQDLFGPDVFPSLKAGMLIEIFQGRNRCRP